MFNAKSLTIGVLIFVASLGLCSPAQAEEQSYDACFSKSYPMTREEAVCRFEWEIENSEAIDANNFLRETSNLLLSRIFKVVKELNRKRAVCEYEAIHEFSISRSDVSLGELLEWQTGEPMEEPDYRRLSTLPDAKTLGDSLDRCQKLYWEDVQSIAQNSQQTPSLK